MAEINANTAIYDKSVDRSAMIRFYEERVGGKIKEVMKGHELDVMKLIASTPKNDPKLREELDKLLIKNYGNMHDISKRSLMDLIFDQTSYMVQSLTKAIGDIWSVNKPQYRIAEEIALNRPLYNDATLLQGWQGVSIAERKRLEAVIRKGIAQGQSEAEIALEVRKGNVFNISRTQSLGLVRTAMTSVVVQTDHEVYKANEKALQGWQYIAVLDSRTTPICAHRDGTIYDISDTEHLPPSHWNCRSTTVPVVKHWSDLLKLDGVAQIRRKNLESLTDKQKAYYDGLTPSKESYQDWLSRQPTLVQLKHLGDYAKVEAFQQGKLTVDKFTNDDGKSIGIKELRQLTNETFTAPGDTTRFGNAKEKLDAIRLGVNRPEDLINNPDLQAALKEYYLLQAGDLDGTLSLTSYRGTLVGNKKATKTRVLNSPPREENLKYNPVTGRYDDSRMYQPSAEALENSLRLVNEAASLKDEDKVFINNFIAGMENFVGTNERAVITENLRIVFTRFRDNKEPWANFKAVLNSQMKFDVMNVSDYIETQLRKDGNLLTRLKQDNYIDPVLGVVQLDDLEKTFIDNIKEKNAWEDKTAPKIAKELRGLLDLDIPLRIRTRLSNDDLEAFYLRFANRLSVADTPDRDQLAVSLGRDLYNSANWRGDRRAWFDLGSKLLNSPRVKSYWKQETTMTTKRRMKSRLSGQYFGPYYDSFTVNIRIVDPRIQRYAQLTRKVDVGLRLGVFNERNKLYIRPGFKTYWTKGILGYEDTRIPITSTNSFSDFPEELVDNNLSDALNWASTTKYKVDPEFHDFIEKLLMFEDDKGKAQYYHGLNQYRSYIAERGDAYERFKAMKWLRDKEIGFANHAFVDHRARIYDRGMISPQSGETFRPFLNTSEPVNFSPEEFDNLQDQIGAFLGGLSDHFEGRYNSLSILGRQKIAEMWRDELVKIGNHILRNKPGDIRAVLESDFLAHIEGEEQGKAMRFALEMAKIDKYLKEKASVVFQEPDLSFIRDGDEYIDINKVHQLAHLKPIEKVNVDDVNIFVDETLSEHSARKLPKGDEKRIKKADLDAPVVVELDEGQYGQQDFKYHWLDGYHRLVKAKRDGIKEIQVQVLSAKDVKKARVQHYDQLTEGNPKEILWGKPINPYSPLNLRHLNNYKISVALEQDASSSGAQIIALTTKNKQLANLSNVIPTNQKQRLYDEIAAATYQDPRFQELNKRLGLSEKDLRKAAKAQNMVTFYGAGERTGILNVEGKLAKALSKQPGTMVVKASDRDKVLNEISARMARYEKFDPDTYEELKALRQDVRDIFNKGQQPSDDIMYQLYFLEPKTRDLVDKMTRQYDNVVTPQDFSTIAKIMSENLSIQVPILKDFTRFFGRLAEDFVTNAKPGDSKKDLAEVLKEKAFGQRKGQPPELLNRIPGWHPGSPLSEMLYGVREKKLPKKWTNIPWVNFDGKTIEQNFTQVFEERLTYKDKNGKWVTNILQVPQKTDPTFWDELVNKSDLFNDIVDAQKARTAFAVNGNHSNDAVIVKRFHLWGKEKDIPTSTIHDAFFTNAAKLLEARSALREIYGDIVTTNPVQNTLDEMYKRGLPKELYKKYLNEAIDIGLIPVVGRSRVGGKLITEDDILTKEDILAPIPKGFKENLGWYGIG
jgi:SPP1 gp7 family putative phage head morphogenesis protein